MALDGTGIQAPAEDRAVASAADEPEPGALEVQEPCSVELVVQGSCAAAVLALHVEDKTVQPERYVAYKQVAPLAEHVPADKMAEAVKPVLAACCRLQNSCAHA